MKENTYNRNNPETEAVINRLIASHERVRIKATVARTGYRSSAEIIKPMVMFRNFTIKGTKISRKLVANYTKGLCSLGEFRSGDQIVMVARFSNEVADFQYKYSEHDQNPKPDNKMIQFIAPVLKEPSYIKRVKPQNPRRKSVPSNTLILAGYVMVANRRHHRNTVSYYKGKYFRDLYLGWLLSPNQAHFSIKKWNRIYNRQQHLRYYKKPKDADNQNILLDVIRQGVKSQKNDVVHRMQKYLDEH